MTSQLLMLNIPVGSLLKIIFKSNINIYRGALFRKNEDWHARERNSLCKGSKFMINCTSL